MKIEQPFAFGTLVSEDKFVNRELDKARLIQNFSSGINTILISPRRWGKSSLVKESARLYQEQNKKNRVCFIDMFSIRSEEEFYTVLAKEVIKVSSSKWEDWINDSKTFFKQIIPKFSISSGQETDLSLSLDWDDAKQHKDEILNLAENIAIAKGIKITICIDEFQNLNSFKDSQSFEKSLRSSWQHHKHVNYCLYGCKRHMMETIFNKKTSAFYRFGEVMLLQKIEQKHWTPFLLKAFKLLNISIPKEVADYISEIVKAHPYYLQQLAYTISNSGNKEVAYHGVGSAFETMINTNALFYEKEIEWLSTTQINLLKAIAEGHYLLSSIHTMRQYKIGTPRNISKNKRILEQMDIIDIANKRIEFIDPVFEQWFRNTFLSK